MELINKEDAVALIKAEMDKIRTHSLVDGTARINLRLAKNIIEDMPTIDIVKCVDCRKCKEQGGHANCNGYLYCTRQKTLVDEDCFCAWGEER